MHDPTVIVARLPRFFRGLYDRATHTIWIDDRLSAPQHRCTLAHELVHAERGDHNLPDPVLNARQERLVHSEAARRRR